MKEFKASTKAGQRIVSMGQSCYYSELYEIYDNWSSANQEAFEWCRKQFMYDDASYDFGIGNANTFGFTASWYTLKDGEKVMRVETKDNSYLVWLER